MSVELTEQTTPEEIQAFVDEIAEERAGQTEGQTDKPGDKKSDAAIVNGHADNEKKDSPVIPRDDETVEAPKAKASKGKDEKAADRSWLDDDLKSEVSAYGISEEELADFTSREEVERALRFFDKSALEAGRKALAEGESKDPVRDDKGRFTKTETPAQEPEKASVGDFDKGGQFRYEVKLDKSVYDDEIVDEFTRMRDHYESRLEALESRLLEVDAKAEEQHFDSLVDSLGHADLFGKTDKEDAKQLQRRQDLHVAVKAQMLGLQALGRPTEMSESLISRVARMVFAEELGKKELKSRTNRLSRQSNGRMGGGATRPSEPREDPRDEADRLYRELVGA